MKSLFGLVFVLAFTTAHAQTEKATVKYLGVEEDMIVFNVSYANPEGNKFLLSIRDQQGNALYQSTFNDKTFYKQFRLPRTEKDNVVFLIRNMANKNMARFQIEATNRMVEDVVVREMP